MEPTFIVRPLFKLLALSLMIILMPAAQTIAQEEAVIKDITATLADSSPEEEDLSALTERLEFYRRSPIELSHVKPEQLKELVFLSPLQLNSFFAHIQANGPLKDLLELQAIEHFDLETISRLLPFVTLKTESAYSGLGFKKLLEKGKHELLLRYGQTLEKQRGFRDLKGSHYLGSPQKLLLKYKYNLSNLIGLSFVVKKDAGEALFSSGKKSGFDFISGSLSLAGKGIFKRLIVGDYSLQFGQGLSLWSGSTFGKGPDVTGAAKKDSGLKPYTSTNEFSYFRGAATVLKVMKSVDFIAFISTRNLDASLKESDTGEDQLSTIGTSGLHRTATEINNRRSLHQLLYGSAIGLTKTNFDVGISAYHSTYSHEFITGNQLYKRYSFTGKELSNLSSYYNYTYKSLYIFGETAKSFPGETALINGVMTALSPVVSAVLVHRNYSKEFHSFYTKSFGEGSASANENGIYGGLHFSPTTKFNGSVYLDAFHFPWAKYRVDKASSGYDMMVQLSYSPQKKLKVMLKASNKKNEQNESAMQTENPVLKVRKSNYRLQCNWKANRKISLENRIEVTRYRKGNPPATVGFMLYQDAGYSPLSSRVSANFRLAYFQIPTYENRVYAYEDDVLYGAGSGLYNGKGFRSFLNLNYRITAKVRTWVKYAAYLYPGKEKIGSGLDEINGNKKSEIKVQLRYQF